MLALLRPSPLILFAALLAMPVTALASSLVLNIGDIETPDLSLRGIELTLPEDGSAELKIAGLRASGRELSRLQLRCARFELSTAGLHCAEGRSKQLPGATLEFDYRFFEPSFRFSARLRETPASALAAFVEGRDIPAPNHGKLDGTLRASGDAAGLREFAAELRFSGFGFGDASGLHAAENLDGSLKLDAVHRAGAWNWSGDILWQRGEMFWQPLYLGSEGERRLSASGTLTDAALEIARAEAELPKIGKLAFSGAWSRAQGDRARGRLQSASLAGRDLELGRLFSDYVRPFLEGSALFRATLAGRADIGWRYRDGATESLHLALRGADLGDEAGRYALRGVDTEFDWRPDAASDVRIAFGGGELLGMPLGAAEWKLAVHGLDIDIPRAELPVLDGKLELRDFSLRRAGGDWRWQFGAGLSRISMERFSQALGWPKMLGTLAGRIPKVSYDGREIVVDGALLFEVFDGSIVATKLRLADPFGPAPRLQGDLGMRGLDLGMLTRTFSFGNMLGRIDVDVTGLELQNWKPARFDARVASSPGRYPKKISQKAVQNISALGGAGAAAALQRGFLQAFESFGYSRIGWRCRLQNGVCLMAGTGDAAGDKDGDKDEAYAIIEGGGIPAVTVMGYNRRVSWDVLIERLKRVTKGNAKPVID